MAARSPQSDSNPHRPRLLIDFFAEQVRRAPEALAIDIPNGPDGARSGATYGELAGRASAVHGALSRVVTGEGLIGILLPRTSIETYACQLGVMQAGAGYVSLDPALPDARLVDIVTDADPAVVLTDPAGATRARRLGLSPDRILALGDHPERAPLNRPAPTWLTPASLAYVIYTSGTTGRPKGVMVEHGAIANLIATDLIDLGMRPTDRVAQTSSHSYDSAVEETWIALASGATVVVLDDDAVRAGPDVLPWLERERVTVWCPSPSLLRATGCRVPEATPPGIRLVYVGGEAMPPDIVSVWAPGRRLVNGYGPTECAVVATRAEMSPGQPISIGTPIRGNTACVLDEVDGQIREVAPGQVGELYLGGAGLARGYWRAPELTAAKFIDHPQFGRLYRTGDLASRADGGELFCHGRRDSQVKVRGHRVELEDVESHIARLPGVRAVGCALSGHSLAAVVVPIDPGAPPAIDGLISATAAELPLHMVPSRIRLANELPMTAGGKLDRPQLLELIEAEAGATGASAFVALPATHLEALIVGSAERALARHGPAGADAHFFDALGADSLGAAELVTALREHDETASVTVRDLYEHPTPRRLAAHLSSTRRSREELITAPPRDGRLAPLHGSAAQDRPGSRQGFVVLATVVQAGWLAASFVVTAAIGAAIALVALPWLIIRVGLLPSLALAPLVIVAALPVYAAVRAALAVAVKRVLIGAYRARVEPMWGGFYLRHWIVQRAVSGVPCWLFEGTEFQAMFLRALGARIGRRVHLHRGVDLATGGWDLLSLGDDVTLAQDASVRLVDVEAGTVTVGPVVIEAGATVEVRAGLAPHTRIGRAAVLTALSSLGSGSAIPAGERWSGVPAELAGPAPAAPALTRIARELPPLAHGTYMVAARLGIVLMSMAPIALTALALAWLNGGTASSVLAWLASPVWTTGALTSVFVLALAPLPATLTLEALAARALGAIAPGVISRGSLEYVRVWTKGVLVDKAGPWLSGALAWRTWLRLAGARIGSSAEVSTIIDVVPEQIEIGEGTFLTDGIYLGGPRVDRGTVTMAPTRLGRRVFIGNHAVVPCGQDVPDEVLVGVCTVADDTRLQAGSAWFGHPAFALARRPDEIDAGAFTPSWPRYAARVFFEAARFALPVLPLVVAILWYSAIAGAYARLPAARFFLVAAPSVAIAAALLMAASVIAFKWLLLGRVRPGRHDFWSCWCFRWDLLYVAWQQLARPLLTSFEGTLMLAWYLRAMGARIGRRVVLGRGFAQVVDPDMLDFDDDSTVRGLLQAHTFEGRVLKIDRVRVGRGASVGSQALLFYGTAVGDLTRVAPHSVVMKKERLPAGREYEGCPTRLAVRGVARLTA